MARFGSIGEIAFAGLRVRVWCWRCANGKDMDAEDVVSAFEVRGWPLDLRRAVRRFRCRECGSSDQAIILPASQPPPEPDPYIPEDPDYTWARAVEAFFHSVRARKDEAKEIPYRINTVSIDSRRREGLAWALHEAERLRAYPPLRLVRVNGRPVR